MAIVGGNLVVVVVCAAGCVHKPAAAPPAPPKVKLAVLPVESDTFPKVAKAATDALVHAKVSGVDETAVSKVSLEVVQLSIECVDPTAACYTAVGKSLAADRMLFAQVAAQPKKHVKVTVTLFDVGAGAPKGSAEKVFANETEASAQLDTLVGEATR